MKLLYTLSVLFLLLSNVYAQDISTAKSIKSSSKFIRINTKGFRKIAQIHYLKANMDTVFSGEAVTLSWDTENIQEVSLETSINGKDYTITAPSLEHTGTIKLTPQQNTFYRIHSTENITQVVRVIVKAKPVVLIPEIVYFKASKEQIKKGEKVKLSWLVNNVSRVSLEFGESADNTIFYKDYLNESFEVVTPPKTTYYIIRMGDLIQAIKVEVIK